MCPGQQLDDFVLVSAVLCDSGTISQGAVNKLYDPCAAVSAAIVIHLKLLSQFRLSGE
jgi:hypothetical protein